MKPSPLKIDRYSDRFIDYFLLSYFLGGMVLAMYYDTWLIGFGVGGLSLAAYYLAKWVLPHSDLYQYVLSGILGIWIISTCKL